MKKSIGLHPLAFPAPVWVVGTYDRDGRPDMMTAAWAGVCCSDPPCVSVSVRPSRYTYDNITLQKCFTVNLPPSEYVNETDYFGLTSGREIDKVAAAQLTAVRGKLVNAPVIEEFPLIMECRLKKQVKIGSHTEFIGEILDIRIDESYLNPDGEVEAEKTGFFVLFNGYRSINGLVGDPYSAGKKLCPEQSPDGG
ncbi:MAG: flavin reductase family protein [Candidatus Krumholzibacteriales bacterium]